MKADKKLRQEIESSVPELSENIAQSVDWERIKLSNEKKQTEKKKNVYLFRAALAACCAVILCLVIGLPFFLSNSETGLGKAYAVTIEVNPRIRLEADERDIVTRQYGLNQDGVVLLYKENYVGQTVEKATAAIVRKLHKHGFLKGNQVKVCVKDKNGKDYNSKQNTVASVMEKYLDEFGKGNVTIIDEDEFKRIEDEFDKDTISEYEKDLIIRYKDTVLTLAYEKKQTMLSLYADTESYAQKNEKDYISDLPCLPQIIAFSEKYGYELDFEPDEVCGDDLYEFRKELIKDVEKLQEAIEEIEEGKDEDDYKDMLKDIYKLAEDYLFEDD